MTSFYFLGSDSRSLSVGGIVGGTLSALVVIVLIVVLVVLFRRKTITKGNDVSCLILGPYADFFSSQAMIPIQNSY
jgi:lipid-binding SYLF domain-containing protein